jgi:uncharacterized membrane protein YhaH (DUF805 family)
MLLANALLFVIIAIVIAFGVIPPARVDPYPGVNHQIVAGAFWMVIILNLLSAFFLFLIAIRLNTRIGESKPILIIIGIFVLILGVILSDGALAWQKHGPSMQSAAILVFICAAIDFLSGVTLITMAFLLPKKV